MNRFLQICLIGIALLLWFCCEDREHTNPVDSNVDIIAPANLQLSQQNIHTVLLSWSFSGDKYEGFVIDRKVGSDSMQIAYDTVACGIHSYIDTSAIPTESHTYRICAYADENRSSSISKDITLVFPVPENLQLAQLSDTTVALQWQDKSDGEDGFIINRKKDSGTWENEIWKTTATTWTDSTVSPGSAYSYQVKAYKGTKTTTAVEAQYQNVFQAPSILSATAIDDQSLQLNWTDNCGYESGFRIERNDGSGFIQVGEVSADIKTHTDTELSYGQSYTYRVKAFTANNESDYSNESNSIKMIIPAPTTLTATQIDDQSLLLFWTKNCDFESGYRIERNDGGSFIQIEEVNADVTTYTDLGLTYGQSYSYRVKAFTTNNESCYSNLSNSVEMIILSPTNLTATIINDETAQLTWEDNCTFETGYTVERKEESGTFTEIADLSANTENYTDEGLILGGKFYLYRVAAYTLQNISDYSNEVEIGIALEGFVFVSGSTFTMGDVWGDGANDETPTHEVTVSSFFISKYEVTQELYQSVMGNNPSYFTGDIYKPVELVSWYDAVEFCNALSTQKGLTPCYTINGDNTTCDWDANGYRLPTEAEWEYAARSGGRDDRKYSGTNTESNLGDYAYYDLNSGGQTHRAGDKQPNDLGIYDMSGNVFEWCWDWAGSYSSSSQTNPTGPSSGSDRIIRGGNWSFIANHCRVANRNYHDPSIGRSHRGFRILRTP